MEVHGSMNYTIKIKRGTKATIPVLQDSEMGFPTDEKELYIGTANGNEKLTSKAEVLKLQGDVAKIPNKNWCINGNMNMWQRGNTFNNPVNNTYTADRFVVKSGNASASVFPSNISHTKQELISGEIDRSTNFYRITTDGSGAINGSDSYLIGHIIENGVKKLCGNGKSITVSFYARSNIANKKIGISGLKKYGSGGTPSSNEILTGDKFSLTSSFNKFSVKLNTNTLVGKTFGSANDDYLRIGFYLAWGVGMASDLNDTVGENFVGAGYVDIAQIKIESGDVVTPFESELISRELNDCKRYYQQDLSGEYLTGGIGIATGTTTLNIMLPFDNEMRAIPSIIILNNKLRRCSDGVFSTFTTNTRNISNKAFTMLYNLVLDTNLVVGQAYQFQYTADSEIY
jgi:hypothetical protein